MAGSTRQQPVGRINQVADRGDGDEDEDKDEIPSYAVLLTASVERYGVSRMRDFFPYGMIFGYSTAPVEQYECFRVIFQGEPGLKKCRGLQTP